MSKDKQIEEMAKIIYKNSNIHSEFARIVAEELYNEHFRKASEVAREIFGEILEIMSDKYKSVTADCHFNMRYGYTDTPEGMRNLGKAEMLKYIGDKIAELKKKYTEDGK